MKDTFAVDLNDTVAVVTGASRGREPARPSESPREAIGRSGSITGRIIASAAVLFAVSIGAFGTSNIIVLNILGIGTAFAVLVDAVLVRCLLLPATLTLLDRRAWWLPGSLARLHGASTCMTSTRVSDRRRSSSQAPPSLFTQRDSRGHERSNVQWPMRQS